MSRDFREKLFSVFQILASERVLTVAGGVLCSTFFDLEVTLRVMKSNHSFLDWESKAQQMEVFV